MKKLILSLATVFCFGTLFVQATQADPGNEVIINSYEDILLLGSCSGSSILGGTCSASCSGTQSCSCSSGIFTCSCSCSGTFTSATPRTTADPGPESNWLAVASVLSKENNRTATEIAKEMPSVFRLASTNPTQYAAAAERLEAKAKTLPASILQKIHDAVK